MKFLKYNSVVMVFPGVSVLTLGFDTVLKSCFKSVFQVTDVFSDSDKSLG